MTLSALLLAMSSLSVAAEDAPPPLISDGEGGFVLEDLVVVRDKVVDGVRLERNGTFSLLKEDPSVVFSALSSGPGAALNLDVAFAKHSVVMTADGQQTIETIARALRLIGSEYPFTISIRHDPKLDPSGRRGLTKGRAQKILQELSGRQGLKNKLMIKYSSGTGLSQDGTSRLLPITIINIGADSAVSG